MVESWLKLLVKIGFGVILVNFEQVNASWDSKRKSNLHWGSSIKYVRKILRVPIRGLEMLAFRKILHTYLMDDPLNLCY